MTKQTHGEHGGKNSSGRVARCQRATLTRRQRTMPHQNDGSVRLGAVPLPEDGELRRFLCDQMAVRAAEMLIDIRVRQALGTSCSLDKELHDAAIPAIIHLALASEASTVLLDEKSWWWMKEEVRLIVADWRECEDGQDEGDRS